MHVRPVWRMERGVYWGLLVFHTRPVKLYLPRELPYFSYGSTFSGGAAESNPQGDGSKTSPSQSGTNTTTRGVLCYISCRIITEG